MYICFDIIFFHMTNLWASLFSYYQYTNDVRQIPPARVLGDYIVFSIVFLDFEIGLDQIEALYQYAQFQFECGNYSGAADYLYQYGALCTNSERNVSALWGKLAAEILMQNWDLALEELNRLKEIIDSKVIFG
ncbi:Eukaryotic translation initiation factor 3 subunit E [Zea mays]|uniref:Eukaryotic translation initiation factor 3 subunit E n=1 Tax=Zea mays TaxID=4577 RepID=A0A1D6Q4Z4_MAIZE|nr:Eukaryotic translation initiation factor 3 subunit E [Zea mays]